MSFVDRVKSILLKKNEEELANIETKIAQLERIHSRDREYFKSKRFKRIRNNLQFYCKLSSNWKDNRHD